MIASQDHANFEKIVRKIEPQGTLLRVWTLEGGVSAQVTALEIGRPDTATVRLVVRRYGEVDLKHNPQIAVEELRVLESLQSSAVPAPKPVYSDQSGEIFSTPYIVVEYIEGKPEFAPPNLADFISQMALNLSGLHRIEDLAENLPFLPRQSDIFARRLKEQSANTDESLDIGLIVNTLGSKWSLSERNKTVLLHGDYWPGNILWRDGELVGIIDWEDAQLGDPLADLANSRLEVLWAFGIEAMQLFTRHYRDHADLDFTNLPYWDLYAALRHASKSTEWSTYEGDETVMRERYRLFTGQAFSELSAHTL